MVEFRAFRGSRRSSVYRSHTLTDAALARIVDVAARERLPALSSLGEPGPHDVDKRDARRFADEATSIRAAATLLELDEDLTALAEVANWCARSREDAWLRIETR